MNDMSLITTEITAGIAALLAVLLYMVRQSAIYEKRRRELELRSEAQRQQDEAARDAYNMRRDESLMRMLIEAQGKMSAIESERANLLMSVGELTARVDMNMENIRLLRQELEDTRASLEQEKRENARLRAENARLMSEVEQLRAENNELRARLVVLEQRVSPPALNVEFLSPETGND